MRYELRLTAYDVMEFIHCSLVMEETNGPSDAASGTVLTLTASVRGRGISEPREWAHEALRTVLAHLSEKPPRIDSWGLPSGGTHTISGVADSVDSEKD